LDEEMQALVGDMVAADEVSCGECLPRNRDHVGPYGVDVIGRCRGIDVSLAAQCPLEVLPYQEAGVPGDHLT
jgi:hypothetical protein